MLFVKIFCVCVSLVFFGMSAVTMYFEEYEGTKIMGIWACFFMLAYIALKV